jgi:hypothetical protein
MPLPSGLGLYVINYLYNKQTFVEVSGFDKGF